MFQKQKGQSLPNNIKNKPQRDGNEHAKEIALQLGKAIKPPIIPIHKQEEILEDVNEPTEEDEEAEHHEPIDEVAGLVSDPVMSNPSTTKVSTYVLSSVVEDSHESESPSTSVYYGLYDRDRAIVGGLFGDHDGQWIQGLGGTSSFCSIPEAEGLSRSLYKRSVLQAIDEMVGNVIKIDLMTDKGAGGQFARFVVQIDLSKPFISRIRITSRIHRVEYEYLLTGEAKDLVRLDQHENTGSIQERVKNERFGEWIIVNYRSCRQNYRNDDGQECGEGNNLFGSR
ncbi:hypothetical protein Golob_007585 [Gossypium lobatum]|uniref:Uncharacterized protein n=1 Tax=Gossypium lobatum TaxID=34289 RepID=A0A7J8MD75_9ROSI|nr:hypothetical protein [Gossypium lobatum]